MPCTRPRQSGINRSEVSPASLPQEYFLLRDFLFQRIHQKPFHLFCQLFGVVIHSVIILVGKLNHRRAGPGFPHFFQIVLRDAESPYADIRDSIHIDLSEYLAQHFTVLMLTISAINHGIEAEPHRKASLKGFSCAGKPAGQGRSLMLTGVNDGLGR